MLLDEQSDIYSWLRLETSHSSDDIVIFKSSIVSKYLSQSSSKVDQAQSQVRDYYTRDPDDLIVLWTTLHTIKLSWFETKKSLPGKIKIK